MLLLTDILENTRFSVGGDIQNIRPQMVGRLGKVMVSRPRRRSPG